MYFIKIYMYQKFRQIDTLISKKRFSVFAHEDTTYFRNTKFIDKKKYQIFRIFNGIGEYKLKYINNLS